jgi:hypothetical protein
MRLLTLDFSGLGGALTDEDICIQTKAKSEGEIVQEIAKAIEHLYRELKCPSSSPESAISKHIASASEQVFSR